MTGGAVQAPAAQPGSAPAGAVYAADRVAQRTLQATSVQQDGALRAVAETFNWWGGSGIIWFAALMWLVARAARKRRMSIVGLRGVEAIAISSAISGIIKGLAGRSRPFLRPGEPWHWDFAHGWTDARYFSMPSGHTTATFAFATAASVAVLRLKPAWRGVTIAAAFIAAAFVAFARVYLDQHWLSDVVAGAVLGGTTGFVIARWHAGRPATAFDRVLLGSAPPHE